MKFEGYACVTETPYDMGWYTERIARGAFKKTLAEDPDVQLVVNHGGLPLARTKSGTMRLEEDVTGLKVDADLDDDDPDVQSLDRKMKRGDIDQMSFAFRVTRQTWSDDYGERRIAEVDIHRGDVSVVNQGANPATSSAMRSMLARAARDSTLAERRRMAAVVSQGLVVLEMRSFSLDGVRYEVRDPDLDEPKCNRCNGEGMIALQGQAVTCPQCKGSGGTDGNASSGELDRGRRNRPGQEWWEEGLERWEVEQFRKGPIDLMWRSKYTDDEIEEMGRKGHAFKNASGSYSFPIEDEDDLRNAIRAVGRSKSDHDAVRKYIIGRAKDLGLSNLIPERWNSDGSLKAA